ncbi:MAG TPA: S53 family peptidase [Candidatus Udaeobacter sp.]|nr:S53 family peptidase [Candidatus Udaeobacter sp.]
MNIRLAAACALVATVAACAGPHQGSAVPTGRNSQIAKPPPTLAEAIRRGVRLGPAGRDTVVDLSFGLTPRNQAELQALIASGRTVAPAAYSALFGPDAAQVAKAVAAIDAVGMRASWQPGWGLIAADGPAPAAARLLGVDIENYRFAGSEFYATLDQPHMPPQVAAVAAGVSGLDDYRGARGYAVRPGGMTPTDLLSYYNVKPLQAAGLDGTGETILFPEIDDLPNLSDLDRFASEFGLPAFDSLLTVKRDANWGTPGKPAGETALDLEIAHEIAPGAKLVVYLSAPDFGHGDRAFDQLVTDHLGSIISESLGSCEPDTPGGARNNYAAVQDRAIALGMTHFVASGDNGAYTCGLDQDPAASFPSTLPTVTAVGGTSVFESQQGVYYKEYAWSSPIDESGGGGGASQFYALPGWQKNEAQASGHGLRQVPDVSADGDPSTGFHIVFAGQDAQVGGTSAATPMWAGTAALIDQDLRKHSLREVGFANPALYYIGENSARLNPRPFHDVTQGNNLGFDAGTGWDFATGWGSMDAAALDSAWIQYIKGGGS